jgi:transketolase
MTQTPARPDIPVLKEKARLLRKLIIEMTTKAGSGHPSSSMSAAEVIAGLYFGGILRHRPDEPKWPDRDRFVLSKGHACPVLYAALAECGYFPMDWLWGLRQIGQPLEGHPNVHTTPGIEASTGSLGQGLSTGVGMAVAGQLDESPFKVYVMTGDGEINEGQIWEAAASAAKRNLKNLVWIIDKNGYQQTGATQTVLPMDPLADKARAFGWHVREVDGQDMSAVMEALTEASEWSDGPYCLISHTKKGAGVSFVEADFGYHGKPLTADEAKRAMEELGWQ